MAYFTINDHCFHKNFSRLVKRHGGKWVVIAGGKVIGTAPKSRVRKLIDLARKMFPRETPLAAPIPREEEIQCIL